ncbi:MAG: sigma-70 family RNA polymerase sigma factor [Anaerolineales bacterium]|nr:MAG: sigma-70 family RNA polymerase sigma factor [Anaerolineales bacterium]
MNHESEKELLENALSDLSAFNELYALYFPRIYAYINYRVGGVQDAEDIVASTFLKATERLGQFEWRGDGSFAAWLFSIAHDLVVDSYRRDGKVPDSVSIDELPDIRSDSVLPDDAALRNEEFEYLRQLIGTLSPRRQEIITLRFFGGLRNKEIAGILGLDERTVASHLCRGLEDLHRKYLIAYVQPRKEDAYVHIE